MRLLCLECSAIYEAPDSLFGPEPREVRCNRCGYQWTVIGSRPPESHPAAIVAGSAARPTCPVVGAAPTTDLPPEVAPPELPPAPPSPAQPELALMRDRTATGAAQAGPVRRGSAGLADSLAGPMLSRDSKSAEPITPKLGRPEPAAASTRVLLGGSPTAEAAVQAPDPEERRLSHELAFGQAERRRPNDRSGGSRRIVAVIVMVTIFVATVAVIFKPQIVGAFPGMKAAYAALGL
jgi:predicted Zn finger-like uncharacterized protein